MSSRVVNTPVACSLDGANGWDHAVVDIDGGFLQPLEGGLHETDKLCVEIVDICVTGNSYTWLSLTHTGAPSRMHSCRKRFQPHHTHPVHT